MSKTVKASVLQGIIRYMNAEVERTTKKAVNALQVENTALSSRYYGEVIGILWAANELEKLITEQE